MAPKTSLRPFLRALQSPASLRQLSTASGPGSESTTNTSSTPLPTRWLSTTKARLGQCFHTNRLSPDQLKSAGALSTQLATQWRELVACSEGFLTAEGRRGLWRREVVWGEMDSMVRHVNNVVYNGWAEAARVNWAANLAATLAPRHRAEWEQLWTNRGVGMILRRITTEFKFPMTYPDRITVLHKLDSDPAAADDGTTSFTLSVLQLSERHQRPAARCAEDIVVYDYRAGAKAALAPHMADVFRRLWREQEAARAEWTARVRAVENAVRRLEEAAGIGGER